MEGERGRARRRAASLRKIRCSSPRVPARGGGEGRRSCHNGCSTHEQYIRQPVSLHSINLLPPSLFSSFFSFSSFDQKTTYSNLPCDAIITMMGDNTVTGTWYGNNSRARSLDVYCTSLCCLSQLRFVVLIRDY